MELKTLLRSISTRAVILFAVTALVLDVALSFSPWSDITVLLFFPLFLVGLVIYFFYIKRESVLYEISVPVYGNLLPMSRVLYAAFCLITAFQHLSLVPSGLEPMNFAHFHLETPSTLAYVLSAVYIASLISLLLGRYIRLSWVLIFITGAFIIPYSLEIFFKNTVNFFAIFVSPALWAGAKSNKSDGGWPLFMIGLCFCILMTGAGIFKLLDPVWQKGVGLYYSLNISHYPPEHLWFFLDSKPLMVIGNWLTIFVELVSLPLFLYKRTRFLGLLTLVFLGIFLAYPMMGIGIVGGPIVLAMVPALISIVPQSVKFREKLSWLVLHMESLSLTPKRYWTGGMTVFSKPPFKIFIVFWTMCSLGYLITLRIPDIAYNPPRYGHYEVNNKPWLHINTYFGNRLKLTKNLLRKSRPYSDRFSFVWLLELFDYHHLMNRMIVNLDYYGDSPEEMRTVELFDDDGSKGPDYNLWYSERYLLSAWQFMIIHGRGVASVKEFSEQEEAEIYGLIENGKRFLDFEPKRVEIKLKLLSQPTKFEGLSKPWIDEEWTTFLTYDFETEGLTIVEFLELYDVSKLDIEDFRNGTITLPNRRIKD